MSDDADRYAVEAAYHVASGLSEYVLMLCADDDDAKDEHRAWWCYHVMRAAQLGALAAGVEEVDEPEKFERTEEHEKASRAYAKALAEEGDQKMIRVDFDEVVPLDREPHARSAIGDAARRDDDQE